MQTIDRLTADAYIGKENSVFVKANRLSEPFPLHWHNYFEIEIVTGGHSEITVNGETYDTDSHRVFLLTPIDFHQLQPAPELDLINISFDPKLLSDQTVLRLSQPLKTAYNIQGEAMDRLLQAVSLLQHECSIGGSCQAQLCEYILACLFRENLPASLPESGENLSGIKKAILYLEMHFKEDISLSALAQQAGFNPTYFSELFRRTTGQSYKQRLTQLRIRYAKMLLRNGLSVSQACFESGFGSLSNFTAVFKEHYGITPRQYQAGK